MHLEGSIQEAGVIVTINSDDSPLFNTTLNQEILLLHKPFGFTIAAIDDIVLNGVRHGFADTTRKQELERVFLSDLARRKHDTLAVS